MPIFRGAIIGAACLLAACGGSESGGVHSDAQRVADHPAPTKIQSELPLGLEDHPGLGLAQVAVLPVAFDGRLGVIWAELVTVDDGVAVFVQQHLVEPVVDGVHRLFGELAALVGLIDVGLPGDQVDDATERLLFAERQLDGNDGAAIRMAAAASQLFLAMALFVE